jgi:hypothetical protein
LSATNSGWAAEQAIDRWAIAFSDKPVRLARKTTHTNDDINLLWKKHCYFAETVRRWIPRGISDCASQAPPTSNMFASWHARTAYHIVYSYRMKIYCPMLYFGLFFKQFFLALQLINYMSFQNVLWYFNYTLIVQVGIFPHDIFWIVPMIINYCSVSTIQSAQDFQNVLFGAIVWLLR